MKKNLKTQRSIMKSGKKENLVLILLDKKNITVMLGVGLYCKKEKNYFRYFFSIATGE